MARGLILVVALLLASLAFAAPKWHQLTPHYTYSHYLRDFGKHYHHPAELARREKNFQRSLEEVLVHNAKSSTYKRGINHLSDWDEAELKAIRGAKYEPTYKGPHAVPHTLSSQGPSAVVDWRSHNPAVLTAIKDQGQCGDCWAHAVTEAIESSYALATGQLFVLSQMQVTSCTPQFGQCYACSGSYPTLAYEYVVGAGITEEWIYPFQSYNGTSITCDDASAFPNTPVVTSVNISSYIMVGQNNQNAAMDALTNLGPLSILVDASSWSSYESGIFDGCDYSVNISLDHAVNVVGYGTENGTDYWVVRNSWAPSWGEDGYIRLAKPAQAQCGWNVGAAHSSECYGVGPGQYWSCGMCGILFQPIYPNVVIPPPSDSSSGFE